MADVTLPRANSAPIDARSLQFTTEWYNFFRGLLGGEAGDSLEAEIQALAARIAALEADDSGDFIIQGVGSVSVYGTPQTGVVQITLDNDLTSPGDTYYYGTGPDGLKGFYPVADTVEAAANELTKDVDVDGVTTFGLANTAVTPGTYTNPTVTFDAKGRATFAENGTGGGGVLPLVTGEISGDQPVFVYGPDGSLIYFPVT